MLLRETDGGRRTSKIGVVIPQSLCKVGGDIQSQPRSLLIAASMILNTCAPVATNAPYVHRLSRGDTNDLLRSDLRSLSEQDLSGRVRQNGVSDPFILRTYSFESWC